MLEGNTVRPIARRSRFAAAGAKDWVDLAAIADAGPDLDVDYIEEQLVALRGPTMYPDVARLRALLRSRR